MTVWEYHYEQIGRDGPTRALAEWQALWTKLGEEGWEHSGAITTANGEFVVFKRPRSN